MLVQMRGIKMPTDFGSAMFKPIFDIGPETKVDTFWYLRGDGWDFMAGVFTGPEGNWRGVHRFRYYVNSGSDTAFDGQDTKKVYEIKGPTESDEDRDALIKVYSDLLAAMTKADPKLKLTVMPIKGGQEEFFATISRQPFAHVKVAQEPKGVH